MNKEKLYDLYYEEMIPLLISDTELYYNYEDKINTSGKDLKDLVIKDIKNDFENNFDKIKEDFMFLDYDTNSLEMKNARKVLKEIKKYYDLDIEI